VFFFVEFYFPDMIKLLKVIKKFVTFEEYFEN